MEMGESIRFSGPAAFKLQAMGWPKSSLVVPKLAAGFNLQPWPKAKRPSDAAGWRVAPDPGGEAAAGPSRPASPKA
ncbi:hypothetical protein SGRA_3010 [Saprospira grandis str. Lewin]|uniref:Uncharacterized protein n=1 Tax=Saprospira grandis (strain Lewin) TaxID=984262 RepID=H6KZG2_SAPGL|nr:hypothetical protein SGRA_3010 [Saprospira grandis str. Lewin]